MRVIVACEESQVVCKVFRDRGHEAYSCDTQDCSGEHPEWHIKDDVLKHLDDGWDMMIAHPPCTYLSRTSQQWLNKDSSRAAKAEDACIFFNKLLEAPIDKIAIENPLHNTYARERIIKYSQIIQPLHFGHPVTKATCLWLKNLPPLMASLIMQPEYVTSKTGRRWGKWFYETSLIPYEQRGKARSVTFQGVADAMVNQWGNLSC